MSAWLVSRAHIDALVTARARVQLDRTWDHLDDDALGRMLWAENMLSLAARYGDAADEETLRTYRHAPAVVSVVAALKAIDCYQYQSCEHETWKASGAHAYCAWLQRGLISALPGYDAAPWGIEDEHLARCHIGVARVTP